MAERSINKVQLIGRLGRDAETKFFDNSSVVNFTIATSRRWKDRNEEWQEETEWTNCVLWNGDKLAAYLTKGKQVFVEGRLKTDKYQKDGIDVYTTKVLCDEVLLLGGGNGEGGSQGNGGGRQQQQGQGRGNGGYQNGGNRGGANQGRGGNGGSQQRGGPPNGGNRSQGQGRNTGANSQGRGRQDNAFDDHMESQGFGRSNNGSFDDEPDWVNAEGVEPVEESYSGGFSK